MAVRDELALFDQAMKGLLDQLLAVLHVFEDFRAQYEKATVDAIAPALDVFDAFHQTMIVRLDEMKNPVHNVYIRMVRKTKLHGYDKDELWNVVIKTYPNVGQFWKYPKAEFLKQPVYSRDYPPCKYCE